MRGAFENHMWWRRKMQRQSRKKKRRKGSRRGNAQSIQRRGRRVFQKSIFRWHATRINTLQILPFLRARLKSQRQQIAEKRNHPKRLARGRIAGGIKYPHFGEPKIKLLYPALPSAPCRLTGETYLILRGGADCKCRSSRTTLAVTVVLASF